MNLNCRNLFVMGVMLCMVLFSSSVFGQSSGNMKYAPSSEDVFNPERGFYVPFLTKVASYTPLDIARLRALKNNYQPRPDLPYNYNVSLVLRIFELDGFQNQALTNDILSQIDQDFAIARQAGVKLIVRFAYRYFLPSNGKPPYGDATLDRIIGHLQQLKPVLMKNADVFPVMQMGFVGTWGEGSYTDNFGIPSSYTEQNLKDRSQLITEIFKVIPNSTKLQLRTPEFLQNFITYERPNASIFARIGFHNDAFLASADDLGTFRSFSINPRQKALSTPAYLKKYLQARIRGGGVMGGESSTFNPPTSNCVAQGGQAENEMKSSSFTFLNADYNPRVLRSWALCMDDIKKSLGYRLVLNNASYSINRFSKNLVFNLSLSNQGYAAPFSRRTVYLVLKSTVDNREYPFPVQTDVTNWIPGRQINLSLKISKSNLPSRRTYKLYIWLPDASRGLMNVPDYSIRFANQNTWNTDLGYNDLGLNVTL